MRKTCSSYDFYMQLTADSPYFSSDWRRRSFFHGHCSWTENAGKKKVRVELKDLLLDPKNLEPEEVAAVTQKIGERRAEPQERAKTRSEDARNQPDVEVTFVRSRDEYIAIDAYVRFVSTRDDEEGGHGDPFSVTQQDIDEHLAFAARGLERLRGYVEQLAADCLGQQHASLVLVPDRCEIRGSKDGCAKILRHHREGRIERGPVLGDALITMRGWGTDDSEAKRRLELRCSIPPRAECDRELVYDGIPVSFVTPFNSRRGRQEFGLMTSTLLLEGRFSPYDSGRVVFSCEEFFAYFDGFFDWLVDELEKQEKPE